MRAMVVERYGEPLRLAEVPVPEPGPGEVLVKVIACGVCRSDLKIVEGHMPFSPTLPLPHVPGHEICGEVAACGAGTTLPLGQRVVVHNYWSCGRCRFCLMGEETLCDHLRGWVGFTSPGGFQEYLVVPEAHALPLPPAIDPEGAGVLSCAVGTSYHALVSQARVQPGETVVILGVGGVGLHAVQVARVTGAKVIAVDVEEARLAAARDLGAMEALRAGGEAEKAVQEITSGIGADIVVDCVGTAQTFAPAIAMVRKGGRIVVVGYTTDSRGYPSLPTDLVALRQLSILGSRYVPRVELERVIDLAGRGLIRPVVSEVLDLSRANDALDLVRRDRVVGRVVLRIGQS
ncbi:MAG: alcohol dehydrogenase catalytic domain-containing protein [Armatimonadota bacterium]|nr:alcohol dehydrogenase catalytic domain-containing protein [Armatimonadota bacterium]